MIQLSYQPAFDPFHTVFRFLRLRETVLKDGPLHEDHLKILDYYLLFPFRIDGIRLQQSHRKFRRLAKQYTATRPYGERPEDRILFARMNAMQSVALGTMSAKHLIESKEYGQGTVVRTDTTVPENLTNRVIKINAAEEDLVEFLIVLAREYEFLGNDGLKARSKLMKHRYDAV